MQTGYLAARLVATALGGSPQENVQSINYGELLAFSKEQSVAALVCSALEKLGCMPDEYRAAFANEKRIAMAREATQEIETQEIADELRAKGVRFMLLKGCVMKQLYPLPYLRTMCDIDIQYDTSKIDEIKALMAARGYTLVTAEGTGGVNVSFKRVPFMRIEFHGVLMDDDIPAYNAYFGTDFERTVSAQGSEVKYTDEDFFVFMAAHLAKHYFWGGTGLRSVADLWLYLKSKPSLNTEYINGELKKIELDGFVKIITDAAQVLFEGAQPDKKLKAVCEYILNSKTYGTAQNLYVRGGAQSGKAKYLLRRLFPEREFMSINYPAVKKCILLLPLFWLIRLVTLAFGGSRKAGAELSAPRASFDARSIEGMPQVVIKQ